MDNNQKRIVIVGGGITGLSAAYYAGQLFEQRGIPVHMTLVDKSSRLGGRIQTLHRDGFIIEQGPDSFLARKPPILSLIRELGLEDQLAATNPHGKANYIWHQGKLHPMPLGLVLGIPTQVTPFIKTGLVSVPGKIRAAMDLLLPRRRAAGDESLGSFIKRRLGQEVLEHITEPLLAGIYAGDTQSLSLTATFPQFKQMEQTHRSLILGLLAGKKKPPVSDGPPLPEIARNSMFLSFKGGLSTLINRLTERIGPMRLIMGQGVAHMSQEAGVYKLRLEQGQVIEADAVILAQPAYEAYKLLYDMPEARCLEQVSYASVANIALAYKREQIRHALQGSGFVVPRSAGRLITACTWSSSKWPHVAPPGTVLLRTYVGRSNDQHWTQMTEQQLVAAVRADLADTMDITAEPAFVEITRCRHSMPQYPVGHAERLKLLNEQLLKNKPGLFLCGAGYEGVGIPDCIRQGKQAAELMVSAIETAADK